MCFFPFQFSREPFLRDKKARSCQNSNNNCRLFVEKKCMIKLPLKSSQSELSTCVPAYEKLPRPKNW